MNHDEAEKLLLKYATNQCTDAEKAVVEDWFMHYNENEIDISSEKIEQTRIEIFNKLPVGQKSLKISKLMSRIAAAAATIVVACGIWLYSEKTVNVKKPQYINKIAPGGNHATLILANGKLVNLSSTKTGVIIAANQLTYNDGSKITEFINSGIQTIATPKGGQYQIILPDNSKVWLNAQTSLKFPATFHNSSNRTVELSGEAYFEVAKDRTHPFIVKSKLQQLQVLGTHFNISAYEDEKTTLSTLLEGSIRINNTTVLKPGEQADNTGSTIHVEQVDTDNAIAWKNGEFMFRKESLENVMRKIARWYNVEVVFEDQGQAKKLFGGEISRFTNVSEVLNMLELTGQVHFKIEGRRIMVRK